jgi:hypothetical protein
MKAPRLGTFLSFALALALGLGAVLPAGRAGADPGGRPEAAASLSDADAVVTAETHRAVLLRVAEILEARYPDPQLAKPVADTIRDKVSQGAADSEIRADDLVAEVTAMIDSMLPNRNVKLVDTLTEAADVDAMPEAKRSSTGVRSTRMLPGGTLYLELDRLPGHSQAMNALRQPLLQAGIRAIILDVRDNPGGSGEMVAVLCGHLLPPGSPLYTFFFRNADAEKQRRAKTTQPHFGPDVPVFVLTSGSTASSAEALAFILQEYGRATVVGQRTAGIGNPVEKFPIEERFELTVPFGLLDYGEHRRTFADIGVIPDIPVPAEEALEAALTELGVAE